MMPTWVGMVAINRRREWRVVITDGTRHKRERGVTRRDSASFENGQVRNRLPNFETLPKSYFGKSGVFETGPCNLAGAGFETGVAERALIRIRGEEGNT
jgi:hypothetical protein